MPSKMIRRTKPDETFRKGPEPRYTDRIDVSLTPEMKQRILTESKETGFSAATIVRLALDAYFDGRE